MAKRIFGIATTKRLAMVFLSAFLLVGLMPAVAYAYENAKGSVISEGVFNEEVTNCGSIQGGTFNETVINKLGASITGGDFFGEVVNNEEARIAGGVFHKEVVNNEGACIAGGVFHKTVTNSGTIEKGTFYSQITGSGPISGNVVTFKDKSANYVIEVVGASEKATEPEKPTKVGATFTGWYTDEGLTQKYDFDTVVTGNIILYAGWNEEILTYEVPFTTTVELGGSVAPGKTTFNLVLLTPNGDKLAPGDVEITASVTTNGEGSYSGTMSFTGTHDQIKAVFSFFVGDINNPYGVFVQQANEGMTNWTYDEKVWCLFLANVDHDSEYVVIFPASCEESDNGKRYYVKWAEPVKDQMTFKNIYTENAGSAAEGDNNANSVEEGKTANPEKVSQDGDAIPQTGDNNFVLVFALVIAAAASLICAGFGLRCKS